VAALVACRAGRSGLNPGRELENLADWRGEADAVLVDAPCSGTGTWRRNPETRWRLTPKRLAALCELQAHLLAIGAALVRPGGRLLYVVCSLLDQEGADLVTSFLARQPDWHPAPAPGPCGGAHGPGWQLTPGRDGTDGFFIAALKRV
jgi:16S rRNA (cytosine967-C5)-methyltransferase